MRGHCLRVAICLLLSMPAWATTIVRGSFADVVAEAEIAFEGLVTDVASRELPSRLIVTDVTFRVIRPLKGDLSETVTLSFVGGTVGNRTIEISDMPRFARGDRDIVFAAPGRGEVSPLVRFMQGRFHVVRDPDLGRDVVRQFDGTTLSTAAQIAGSDQRTAAATGVPMLPTDFASAVTAEVARQRARNGR